MGKNFTVKQQQDTDSQYNNQTGKCSHDHENNKALIQKPGTIHHCAAHTGNTFLLSSLHYSQQDTLFLPLDLHSAHLQVCDILCRDRITQEHFQRPVEVVWLLQLRPRPPPPGWVAN